MKKTIHHDTKLNFGKYKGYDPLEVLKLDAGYFLWCRESGTYDLDANIGFGVDAWAKANPGDAKKVIYSASKTRAEKGLSVTDAPASSVADAKSVTHEVSFAKDASANASWDTW